MRSSSVIVMPVTPRVITIAVALGLQLLAFWIAGSVDSLVKFATENFATSYCGIAPAIEQVSQIYQPPICIGSPVSTMGSGTR